MSENIIKKVEDRLLDELNRYVINLEIILATRFLIRSKELKINICPPERKVTIKNKSKNKPPDLIVYDSTQNFVLNEIKSSMNPGKDSLLQILDYLNIESILDDNGNSILYNNYSLNLIINIESYKDASEYLLSTIGETKKNIFSITSFTRSESVPKKGSIYYLFELRNNKTIIEEFNDLLHSLEKVYNIDIQLEGEQLYFISTPPVQYTITILWSLIVPAVIHDKKNQEFSFDNLEIIIKEYYCRWNQNTI
ncbi:MAG: hypothetical protein ACFFBP_11860 [Promethearchaeota archaeon]